MIIIGLGSNLPGADGAPPVETLKRALARLTASGVEVVATSPFYKSAPVPKSDQPWFVNAVAHVKTALGPEDLLSLLHDIESEFGRLRRTRNEARVLDLDLLDFKGRVMSRPGAAPILPHPRMHTRAFVLKPLSDLAPDWRHPTFGKTAIELLPEVTNPGELVKL